MCDIGSCITNVSIRLSHDTDMLVTVEQGVLVVLDAIASTVCRLVCLEAGIRQHDDQPLAVFIATRDRHVLFSDQLREARGWQRLSL